MPLALLVDDDAELLRGVEASGRVAGLDLVTAAGWGEGLCLFHALGPDLVIADYNMPGSRYGLQLLAEICRLRPSVKTILVSGYLDAEDMRRVDGLDLVTATLTKGTAVETAEAILAEVRAASEAEETATDWVAFANAFRRAEKVSDEALDTLEELLRGKVGDRLLCGDPPALTRENLTPPSLVYLDASAALRWAEADIGSPEGRDTRGREALSRVLTGDTPVALSEMTLVEFRSGVARCWRMTDPKHQEHDEAWAARVKLAIMSWVADRRVAVVDTPIHAFEHAMTLVDLAARDRGLKLGAWDAVHVITACAWAHAQRARVQIFTSDPDFAKFLEAFPHFAWFVEIVRVDLDNESVQ